ncbi:MAG TPA: choice-of-anchor tandem repeat GloVer-containing protein [Terriglobia bacterium]|jgi:uncharacterized repeat protein (TIGR03803 family)|nr:choice-of-anchor tandem repeat GloVer-containing protein [Terriglobia bacterium]
MRPESSTLVTGRLTLTFVLLFGLLALITPNAKAQTFSVIHNFGAGSDGVNPYAGLVIDSAGNMYGVTYNGGSESVGTVFAISANGQEKVLHSFTGGSDGLSPYSSLILGADGLYGTTYGGGAYSSGTVFEVSKSGTEKVLYSFAGGSDGANPEGPLSMDSAGNLYGTTFYGGPAGTGVVFEISKSGKESVLYAFGGGTDGANPVAGVTVGSGQSLNLYGTTSVGGADGYGTVFELSPSKSGWKESILYNFQLQNDGGVPYGGLVFDHSGNLYGAATDGGAGGTNGGGTVFELTHSAGGWQFNVLNSLSGWGISGTFRNLLLDGSGNIYATTHCDGTYSAGTVYQLTKSGGVWTYVPLYTFTGGTDGLYSFSNLVLDSKGNLYGTTAEGGANGAGVVFKIKP